MAGTLAGTDSHGLKNSDLVDCERGGDVLGVGTRFFLEICHRLAQEGKKQRMIAIATKPRGGLVND